NRACSLGSDIRSSVSKNFSLPTAFISAMSSVILTYFRMTLNLGGLGGALAPMSAGAVGWAGF
ncbi:MAG: hypothetical protein Q8L45_02840, partial [Xanthomonadaceae bacterium]|nr:hypothetical protein [Xanthomonadaceae bacterium]